MAVVKVNASEPQIIAAYSKPDIDVKVISRTQQLIFSPATKTVKIVNAGPQGPVGSIGSFDLVPVLEEIDTRVAAHTQAEVVHTQATSGRDFVALFQNGII